jgi:hypothetical protein
MPNDADLTTKRFSRAFEQMCNFVAVAQTGKPKETVKGLLQLCLIKLPAGTVDSFPKLEKAVESWFGVKVPTLALRESLDELVDGGIVTQVPEGFLLKAEVRTALEARVKNAEELEERVKKSWLDLVGVAHPELTREKMWVTLRDYLSKAFRRHGMQAAALLDPSIENGHSTEALSVAMNDAIKESIEDKHRANARQAITSFLANAASDPDRTQYIIQLADGAFNFYTLGVAPDLAARLRSKLSPLTLFLDTNFLFGILNLHHNSHTEVSLELLRAVDNHKIPFKLRYHEATLQEMKHTIALYAGILRARSWSRALSRAVTKAGNLSGIEAKYHEKNAEGPADVNEFLRPFEHFDVLLKDKGIEIYRTSDKRLQERTDLYHDYQEWLTKHNRGDKPYETVQHDATVLDAARVLRSNAKSTLEAGALMVTCDYNLYRYDWETAREFDGLSCVLLPNILWQILRPFIPYDKDFDKAFAETFALPEFRAIGSGGSKACSKMLGILASYKDVPEETAMKLLSNDMLLNKLKRVKDSEEFKELVEAAFVQQNQILLEEKAALTRQVEAEKKAADEAKQAREQVAEQLKRVSKTAETELLEKTVIKERLEKTHQSFEEQKRATDAAATKATDLEKEHKKKTEELAAATEAARLAQKSALVSGIMAAISLSAMLIVGFEYSSHHIPWTWLMGHSNSLGLQGGIDLLILIAMFALCVPRWRKGLFVAGIVPLGFTLLQILGR